MALTTVIAGCDLSVPSDNALERVIAGVQSSTTLNEHERRVVAFHEAGHALCRELLDATAGKSEIDAAVDYAQHIPLRVIVKMLGFPQEDAYLFRRFIRMILNRGAGLLRVETIAEMTRDQTGGDGDLRLVIDRHLPYS